MALTISELQVQREQVVRDLTAMRRVRYADREVEYRETGDLERALDRIDREIAAAQSSGGGRVFVLQTGRGLG